MEVPSVEASEHIVDKAVVEKELAREKEHNKELRRVMGWHTSKRSVHERIVRAWRTVEKHARRLFAVNAHFPGFASNGHPYWLDPHTGVIYKRYPIRLQKHTTGAEVFDVMRLDHPAREPVVLFSFDIPDGVELQFVPDFSAHFLLGNLVHLDGDGGKVVPVVGDYACRLEATDNDGVVHRGVVWSGTTGDINGSLKARENGYPTVYNGDAEIHLLGGDRLRLIAWIPKDAESIKFHPLSNPDLSFIEFSCYQLARARFGDSPDVTMLPQAPKKRKAKKTARRKKPLNRRRKHG